MRPPPRLEEFASRYDAGAPQVVWTTLVADLETPVSAFIKLADGLPNSFLFESVEGGTVIGRYSFIGIKPDVIWRCHGDRSEINRSAAQANSTFEPLAGGTLDTLRALVNDSRFELPPGAPPMASALVGYLGYDVVRLVERLPDANPDVLGVPDSVFVRPTVIAVFDRLEDQMTLFTPVWPVPGVSAGQAYKAAQARLAEATARIEQPLPLRRRPSDNPIAMPEPDSNLSRADYHAIVDRAKEYIRAGDIFQVVPSQR
ncbi:MAG TPA: anthranilate synthase component I, partial [Kiloniellales bacterium]